MSDVVGAQGAGVLRLPADQVGVYLDVTTVLEQAGYTEGYLRTLQGPLLVGLEHGADAHGPITILIPTPEAGEHDAG